MVNMGVIEDLLETIGWMESEEVYLSSSTSTADKIGGRIFTERSVLIKRIFNARSARMPSKT
jgi:hypothetical protein